MISKDLFFSQEKSINPLYFDGKVKIREVFNEYSSNEQEVYFVEFPDGSLTTVHYHETEQILIPFYGNGVLGQFDLNSSTKLSDLQWSNYVVKPLRVGEIALVRPNMLHFHGALPGQNFSHVALRKLYLHLNADSNCESVRSQTVWSYDIITEDLNSGDELEVKAKLDSVSKKVRELISKNSK